MSMSYDIVLYLMIVLVYEQQIFYASNNMTVSTIFGITHTFKKHPIVFIGYSNGVLRRYNIDGSIYNELVIPHQLSIQKILQWKHVSYYLANLLYWYDIILVYCISV